MSGGRVDQLDISNSLLDLTSRVRALEATPTFDTVLPSAIYVGVPGGSPIAISPGANGFIIKFEGGTTNRTDIFQLKGAGPPYFGSIPAGFYHWTLELYFSDNPAPLVGPIGTDHTLLSDYGQVTAGPVWTAATDYAKSDIWLIPQTSSTSVTAYMALVQTLFHGYFLVASDVPDLEVSVAIENVINSGSNLQGFNLNIVRISDAFTKSCPIS